MLYSKSLFEWLKVECRNGMVMLPTVGYLIVNLNERVLYLYILHKLNV